MSEQGPNNPDNPRKVLNPFDGKPFPSKPSEETPLPPPAGQPEAKQEDYQQLIEAELETDEFRQNIAIAQIFGVTEATFPGDHTTPFTRFLLGTIGEGIREQLFNNIQKMNPDLATRLDNNTLTPEDIKQISDNSLLLQLIRPQVEDLVRMLKLYWDVPSEENEGNQ